MWATAGYVAGLGECRRILIDHRGHGRSDKPRGIEQHRIKRYVADVLSVIDAAGAERVVFVGYSDGSSIGYALAAAHPARVAAVIGLGAVGSEVQSMGERTARATRIRAGGMLGLVEALRDDEGGEIPDWFAEQMLGTDPEMVALELEGWAAWAGPWSIFPGIEATTLIIVGELEESPPGLAAQHAERAAQRISKGRHAVVPGVGHIGVFVRREVTIPEIASVIREVT
jgi:pimeloyl-ACP methyl ester carboxylesterase